MQRTHSLRFVTDTLAIGGTEKHLSYILPLLKKQGWRIRILTLTVQVENDLVNYMRESGIKVNTYPKILSFNFLPKTIRNIIRNYVNFARLWFDFLWDRQSLTHFFSPRAYLIGGIAAKFSFNSSIMVMSRRSMNYYQKKHPFLLRIEQWLQQRTTVILANSQAVLQQLAAEEKIPLPKLGLIYNGINFPVITAQESLALRTQLNLDKDYFIITMVANLIAYKGHHDLLTALAVIKQELGQKWVCLCVGRDDGILQQLQDYADSLGLGAHILWLGARQDVPLLLSISSVKVLCSHEEGFSNALLESMACGIAPIVTAVGGNAEAVIDKQSGLVVQPQQPGALAAAILDLYKNPVKRQQYGQNAMLRVNELFSLERCVTQYDELYSNLLCD